MVVRYNVDPATSISEHIQGKIFRQCLYGTAFEGMGLEVRLSVLSVVQAKTELVR